MWQNSRVKPKQIVELTKARRSVILNRMSRSKALKSSFWSINNYNNNIERARYGGVYKQVTRT